MANGGRIDWTVGFKVDSSGLNTVKKQLTDLYNTTPKSFFSDNSKDYKNIQEAAKKLNEVKGVIKEVQTAYDNAFDSTTGVMNMNKLSSSLKSIGIDKISSSFRAMGVEGIQAFNNITSQVTKANLKFRETNDFLKKIGTTLTNTIGWSISSSAINSFTGAVQQAWGYVQHLDTSLNDIRIVTNKSTEEMDKFAVKANEAAKALGSSTTEYTEAALIYHQQGLSDEESAARAETTLKAANVTGQTGRQVSEELTAVWNGYKVSAEETEEYVDKLAAVAATTASDLEELSTGMSKVASAAANMGVDIDQLNAQLATIVSVTRQAPESAGTALKTIYARIEDLKVGGEDETGVKLGDVSKTLNEVGVDIMDAEGDLRDLGEVIEEVAGKWGTWTRAQQDAIAQAMAGKRQYNNLLALFDNWDMYNQALETSKNATGTLQKQQDIYMESTAAHLQQLQTQWEEFYTSLLDTGAINDFVDAATKGLGGITTVFESMGSGKNVLLSLSAILTKFPGITAGISEQIGNILIKTNNARKNTQEWADWQKRIKEQLPEEQYREIAGYIKEYGNVLGEAEQEQLTSYVEQQKQLEGKKQIEQEILDTIVKQAQESSKVYGEDGFGGDTERQEIFDNIDVQNKDYLSNSEISTVNEMLDNQSQSFEELSTNVIQYRETLQELREVYQEIDVELKENNGNETAHLHELNEQAGDLGSTLEQLTNDIKGEIQAVASVDAQAAQSIKEAIDSTENIIDKLDNSSNATMSDNIKEAEQAFSSFGDTATESLGSIDSKLEENKRIFNNVATEYNATTEEINAAKAGFNEFLDDTKTQAYANSLVNLAGGFASVASGASTLANLGSIITDDDLTTAEKFEQVITAIVFGLPLFISGITQTKTAILGLTGAETISAAVSQTLASAQGLLAVLFGKQVAVNGVLVTSETALNAVRSLSAETLQEVILELGEQGIALDAVSLQIALATGKIDKQTLALILNSDALKENAAMQSILGNSTGKVGVGTQNLINKFTTLDAKTVGLGGNITKLGSKLTGAHGTFLGLEGSTAATAAGFATVAAAAVTVAAVVAAVVIAYDHYKDSLNRAAASAQSAANAAKETTEAMENQKEVVNEVVDSYKELNEQYGESQAHQLRTETYELCKQHNLQDLAVKALVADYKELNNIMAEAQQKANEDYGKSITEEQERIKQAVSAGMWRDADTLDRRFYGTTGRKGLSLKGIYGIGDSKEELELKDSLEGLGIGVNGEMMDYDAFVVAATEHYEELRNVLEGSGTKAAKQLLELLDKQSENLTRNQELFDQNKTNLLDQKYGQKAKEATSSKDVTDIKEQILNDKDVQDMFTDINGVVDTQGIEDWVNAWLQGIDNIQGYIENIDLTESLKKAFGTDQIGASTTEAEIEKQLDGLDDVTKDFIKDHIDLVPAYESVDDFVNHFKDVIEGLQQQQINLKINAIFNSEKSGAYGEEEIADLYNNTNFEEKSGISQESFTAMSFAEQQQALLDYYTVANEQENQYRENVKQTTQDKIDEIDTQIGKLQELRDQYSEQDLESATGGYLDHSISKLTELLEADNKLKDTQDQVIHSQAELTKVIQDFSEGAIDGSDERVQYLQNILGLSEDQIKRLGTLITVQENYNNTVKDFNKEGKSYKNLVTDLGDRQSDVADIQEEASKSTTDWAEAFEEQKERMSNVSSEIDDIQSAYKSLTSIMEDYNETGVLSMDNLQTILSMDSEYLSALQIENGQMSLNEEVLKQLALAKLDEAEATALEETENELLALAQKNVNTESNNVSSSTETVKTKIQECTTALNEGATAWDNYWDAMKDRTGATGEQADAIVSAGKTRIEAIEQVKSQISSGNFSTTMNGTSSSSSGSSGSSSSSESKPDEEDKLKISDIDIYKGINEELDKIESVLGRIQTIDEHSWGKSAIDALTKESKILETQLKTYKEKAEMQEGDLANQRASLEEQGITFSNDGSTMTNASEKLKALYEEYNAMVDTYNAMSKTEQDEYKDTLEKKKDAIDDLEDAIDDYESLYSSYQDTLDSILEKQYEIIEKNVEAFNAEVEVHLELDEAKTAWNDFWYDVVKDVGDLDFGDRIAKSLDNLKVLVGYGSKKTSNSKVSELTSHLTDTTSEVWKQINNAENGGAGLFGSDTAKSKETLTDYRDKLISAVTEAKEAVDDIAQTYLDMLDDAQDKIDKQVKGWEAIEDHINHNVSLIKLISGEKAYDSLVKQYDSLYKNDINLINTQKQSKEFWAGEIKRYESLLANTEKGTKQWKTYTKALETATDNYRDSIKNLDSALESAIQNVQSWRENQVNATFDKLDKAMSGGLGLDLVEEEWNLINNNASKYLDNVERAYSIEEYTLDLDEAANAIGLSAENQAKLNAFRDEELTKLREKNKLTQYDIDESRARLEIMKQEMALEEQKNNKSNMRLRRDSQGNYTYQYTGNDEDIEETEKAGLTARKEWYQLVKNRYTELSKDVIDIYKEQTTLLKEIDDAKLAGDTERENKLLEMYNQNEQYLVQIHEEAEKNKQDLASGTAQYFAEVENAQVLPQSAATVRTLIDQWAGSGKNSFLGAATNAINELDSTQTEYVNRTNKLLQEAGVDYKDLKEKGIDPTTDSLNDLVDSNEDFAEKLEAVNEQLTTQEENLKAAEEAYNNLKTAAADAIEKANECLEKLSETSVKVKETVETNIQAVKNAASEAASAINSLSNSGSGGSSDSGSSNGGNSSSSQKTYRLQSGLSYSGLFKIVDSDNHVVDENTIPELRKKWKGKVTGLKTGGYTGDWNDDSGKLAVLHKKELVLNESDTSNMLKAVDAVRDLVSNNSSADISGIAESLVRAGAMQAQMLAQVGSGLLATMSSIVNNATSQSYNNNMTVNADFSGVRSADAIYQALRELENYGSQVAYSDAPISNKAY